MIAPDIASLAVSVELLDFLEGNPRRGDVEAVMRAYDEFGQRKPIVARRRADGRGEVTAGNTQLAAARKLGWTEIAVVWVDDDDLTAKAWALADNRTSDLGIYDEQALADYLQAVAVASGSLLEATGYSEDDIAALLAQLDPSANPADAPGGRLDEVNPQECPRCGYRWRAGLRGEPLEVVE